MRRLVQALANVRASRIALVCAAVALVASGCHVPFTASGPGASQGAQLTVALVPGVDNAPIQVAANDGLFRGHGLDVKVETYSSLRREMQALSNGNAAIAAGDYADMLYEQFTHARTGKASLHLITDGFDCTSNLMEILALPGSGITTPQELQGKTVATPQAQLIPPLGSSSYSHDLVPYSMETLIAESVLQSDGVTPSDVAWTPTPAKDMISKLKSGQVDAILATEPYVIQAESQLGAVEVLDACSGQAASLPLSGYFSLSSYARTHTAQLRRFRAALTLAQADSANRGPVQAVLPHFAGMTTQDAALLTLGSYPTSLSVDQVQRVADLMYYSGLIGSPLAVSSMTRG